MELKTLSSGNAKKRNRRMTWREKRDEKGPRTYGRSVPPMFSIFKIEPYLHRIFSLHHKIVE